MAGVDGTKLPDEVELAQGDIAAGYWIGIETPTTKKLDADALAWTNKTSTIIDNVEYIFGTGSDAGIYFDTTNFIIRGKVNSVKTIFTNQNSSAVTKTLLTLDADTNSAKMGGFLNLGSGSELTISGGVITAISSYHTVDTESDAPTDDLNTINGGNAGDILILKAESGARTVVVKDGIGNIYSVGDFSLDSGQDRIMLQNFASAWYEISRSNNA